MCELRAEETREEDENSLETESIKANTAAFQVEPKECGDFCRLCTFKRRPLKKMSK